MGIILTIVGLHLFLQGAPISLLAFGEEIGMELLTMGKKWMILLFAFVLGYFGTLAEPALKALAMEVEEIFHRRHTTKYFNKCGCYRLWWWYGLGDI